MLSIWMDQQEFSFFFFSLNESFGQPEMRRDQKNSS
jgi:hypothetical protein